MEPCTGCKFLSGSFCLRFPPQLIHVMKSKDTHHIPADGVLSFDSHTKSVFPEAVGKCGEYKEKELAIND